jgi:hypothetical protein
MAIQHGGEVVDLRAARAYAPDFRQLAYARFAAVRRASGLDHGPFANALTRTLGWSIGPEMVAAWETNAIPPADVQLAAESLAGRGYPTPPAGIPAVSAIHVVSGYADLQDALRAVVAGAHETLAVTGSRSRDPDYLAGIEHVLVDRPGLIHYRVLYGPPRTGALKNHLLRLVDLHRRKDTLHIGVVGDLLRDQERFLCVSESAAVVILPSLSAPANYDTALVVDDPTMARDWLDHARQAYLGADPITSRAAVETLEVVR